LSTQALIERWMADIQLDPTALNAAQRLCSFRIFDSLDVTLEWPEASEDLFVVVDLMPTQGGELRRKRLDEAMRLNAYGLVTRGAVIGWDEVNDRLVLSYRLGLERVDSATLNSAVMNLVEIAQTVQDRLRFEQDVAISQQVARSGASWFQPLKA
jgi:Tir chaperone protein (CesT) family